MLLVPEHGKIVTSGLDFFDFLTFTVAYYGTNVSLIVVISFVVNNIPWVED